MDIYNYMKFPFKDREWYKKLGLGCIILLAPIINILALGYFIKCIEIGARGRYLLPFWDDWDELLRNGLIGTAIILAYIMIPILLIPLFLSVPIIGVIMQATTFLIAGLLIPLAIANYAISDEWQNSFKIGTIIKQLSEVISDYVIIYLIMVLITSVSIAIIFVLPLLALLCALINFYLGVIFANYIGQLLYNSCHK